MPTSLLPLALAIALGATSTSADETPRPPSVLLEFPGFPIPHREGPVLFPAWSPMTFRTDWYWSAPGSSAPEGIGDGTWKKKLRALEAAVLGDDARVCGMELPGGTSLRFERSLHRFPRAQHAVSLLEVRDHFRIDGRHQVELSPSRAIEVEGVLIPAGGTAIVECFDIDPVSHLARGARLRLVTLARETHVASARISAGAVLTWYPAEVGAGLAVADGRFDLVVDGDSFRDAARAVFSPDGSLRRVEGASSDPRSIRIGAQRCAFGAAPLVDIELFPDGSLRRCTLDDAHVISGLPVRGDVMLHEDGTLRAATLAEAVVLDKRPLPAGASVCLTRGGELRRWRSRKSCELLDE